MGIQPIAIVCGSDTPIGSALVACLHSAGNAVIAIDPPEATTAPSAILQLSCDVAKQQGWISCVQQIRAKGLEPSMLAYLVSETDEPVGLPDLELEIWDRVLGQNLRGAYLACKHLFPLMHTPSAAVLLTTVLAGWDASAEHSALSASSGGILALAQSLALAGAPLGIRVNTVCGPAPLPADPACDLPERIPLGRVTAPSDIAEAIMFLLSNDASYLTGSSLVVDGGQSLQSWSNASDAPYSEL